MESPIDGLVDAKKEFTTQIVQALRQVMLTGFLEIYDTAFRECKESNEEDLTMMTFQELLSGIPEWNSVLIQEETERVLKESKHDTDSLEALLSAVFVCHTKVLTSVRLTENDDCVVNLNIPDVSHFIHQAYVECAREFWKQPYLFNPMEVSKIEYQQNLKLSENIIEKGIETTIRNLLPVKDILKKYIDKDCEIYTHEEPDEFDTKNSNSSQVGGSPSSSTKEDTASSKKDEATNLYNKGKDEAKGEKGDKDKEKDKEKDKDKDNDKNKNLSSKVSFAEQSGGQKPPEKSIFNKMVEMFEGNKASDTSASSASSSSKPSDIKTVTTTPLSSTHLSSNSSSKSTPTLNTPVLGNTNNTSNKQIGGLSPISLNTLVPNSTSSVSTSSNVSTPTGTCELSLDSLTSSIPTVNVDYGTPRSAPSSPNVNTSVMNQFDKMSAAPAPAQHSLF